MTKNLNGSGVKSPYSRPKISIYGEFANLTAAGAGSLVEGMMGTALMRQPMA